MNAYTIVTTRIIGELLFEYVRNVENVDYQPQFSPRIMPEEYESSWSFRSSASSDVIVELLNNFFFMQEADYLRLQQKIFYDQLLRWDNIYDTYYWTAQYFYKTGKFVSIDESALSILSISYDDFTNYFKNKLDQLSLELAQ